MLIGSVVFDFLKATNGSILDSLGKLSRQNDIFSSLYGVFTSRFFKIRTKNSIIIERHGWRAKFLVLMMAVKWRSKLKSRCYLVDVKLNSKEEVARFQKNFKTSLE